MVPDEHHLPSFAAPLILASGSPRRRELLGALGLPFVVVPSDFDEWVSSDVPPDRLVVELAIGKAHTIARTHRAGLVIGADTIVVVDGVILNKPEGPADAARMLGLLRDRRHQVFTGVAVVEPSSGRVETGVVRSEVRMRPYTTNEIDSYVASGEPLDKAGSYGIQGAGGLLVDRVEGCFTNVVGLPLCELTELLRRFAVSSMATTAVCRLRDGRPCPRLAPLDPPPA